MTRSRIELGDVTPHNIKQLKKLNTVVFPVSYNEKFYKDVLEVGELAKLAYYNDIVVGAVCCRVDMSENSRRLYIMTLGCLSPYRRLGVGTTMVEHVLRHVEKDGNYDNVYLHVQVNNTGAIDFYKKFGFEIHETKKHYYKRIEPADAHVLQKTLRPNRPPAITNGLSPHPNDNGRQTSHDKSSHHHHHNDKNHHHNDKNHHHNHSDKKQSEK
ncbi:probable N-acetyltransferase san [Rhodnius prolixus]|uniref:probable N-acetyltransferase san n=1 Tax=Rhodnius prolixus TaxID=13249 RepID=UPI003D188954